MLLLSSLAMSLLFVFLATGIFLVVLLRLQQGCCMSAILYGTVREYAH